MSTVTLAQAERIIDAAIERGVALNCRPLSVIVVEPGCKVKAFKKEDGASMIRFEMAFGKAYAALSLGRSSKLVRERAEEKPIFVRYLIAASDDQLFAEGGGMLIRDDNGEVIGAVGVTGDTEDRDEELAVHGIHAAGLKTDEDCRSMGRKIGIRQTKDLVRGNMKVGIFDHIEDGERPLAQLFDERLQFIEAAEAAGIYSLQLAEHHSDAAQYGAGAGRVSRRGRARDEEDADRHAGLSPAALFAAAADRGNLHARSFEPRPARCRRRPRRVAVRAEIPQGRARGLRARFSSTPSIASAPASSPTR